MAENKYSEILSYFEELYLVAKYYCPKYSTYGSPSIEAVNWSRDINQNLSNRIKNLMGKFTTLPHSQKTQWSYISNKNVL